MRFKQSGKGTGSPGEEHQLPIPTLCPLQSAPQLSNPRTDTDYTADLLPAPTASGHCPHFIKISFLGRTATRISTPCCHQKAGPAQRAVLPRGWRAQREDTAGDTRLQPVCPSPSLQQQPEDKFIFFPTMATFVKTQPACKSPRGTTSHLPLLRAIPPGSRRRRLHLGIAAFMRPQPGGTHAIHLVPLLYEHTGTVFLF